MYQKGDKREPKSNQKLPLRSQNGAKERQKCIQKSMSEKGHKNGAKRRRRVTSAGAILEPKSIKNRGKNRCKNRYRKSIEKS